MAYDFAADASKISKIRTDLYKNKSELERCIDEIFKVITPPDSGEGLNEFWSGNSYVAFYESCSKYKPALDGMLQIVNDFLENLLSQAKDTSALVTSAISAFNEINKN